MKKRKRKSLALNKYRIAKLIDLNVLRGGTNTTDVDSNTNPLTMTNCECDPTHTADGETCPGTTCQGQETLTTNTAGVTIPPPPGGTTGIADTLDCP